MNKEAQKVMFSSKSEEWETPQELYDYLNLDYRFTLDPCATPKTAKCEKYYTDTKYWHQYCMRAWKISFIKGRLKFKNDNAGNNSAPFPSAVIIFKNLRGCGAMGGSVGVSTLELK